MIDPLSVPCRQPMGARISIRFGSLQYAALACHSMATEADSDDPIPATIAIAPLPGYSLTFDEARRDELVAYLVDVSNSADEQYERELRRKAGRDSQAMALDRKMREALSALGERVRKAVAA